MLNVLWAILKDGLKALAFWIVASVAMAYFWGNAGRMLSMALGVIFLISFIGVNLKRIVMALQSSGARQGAGPGILDPGPAPPNATAKTCMGCNGRGSISCYGCNGTGRGYDYNSNAVSCFTCGGQGSLMCSGCVGRGVVYG